MEGIRLRSDSTGSTKNAFYHGTIVSNSRHSIDVDNDLQKSHSDYQVGLSPRKRKSKKQSPRDNHPPLPRRTSEKLFSEDRLDTRRCPSVISLSDTANDSVFELSSRNDVDFNEGSFQLTKESLCDTGSQQEKLLGSKLLNNDLRGAVGSSFPKSNFVTPQPYVAKSAFSYNIHEDYGTPMRRSTSPYVKSAVYFPEPTPSRPLLPGVMMGMNPESNYQSLIPYRPFDFLPTEQASHGNIHQHCGSADILPNQKTRSGSSIAQTPPIIDEDDESSVESQSKSYLSYKIRVIFDIKEWLKKDIVLDHEGASFFGNTKTWTIAGIIRWLFYNPLYPEFTSLQQFSWAVVLGVFMGTFTAIWKLLIDACVEFTWKTFPLRLLQWGFFTDLDGAFPLYHYMWITPGLLSGILTYVSKNLPTPIPTQEDWIHTLHSNGIQESKTFIPTFIISTLGMTSGLSLGPELPLILTAGMIGSSLGRICRQSLLQARVMNLTAASAAIGGMFGFPLAGGIFVMELPHRMGLQYFEALSPATIASIVAVLINRIVIDDDVTGMFQYPFLSESLPSYIFKDAIVYGIFGGALGIVYTYNVKKIKKFTIHLLDCCDVPQVIDNNGINIGCSGERSAVVSINYIAKEVKREKHGIKVSPFTGTIPQTSVRAALTSTFAGIAVGITGIFLPHVMFWGEAQLQTLIDKRKTPLPIFGQGDEPTAALVALGQCMMNENEESGLSMRCSIAIVIAKIFVTGLSLGTGIVGGHFWAPLFVGAAASQFFTEFIVLSSNWLDVSTTLTEYPCVALLCIMGATHVVTFRAHMAIILILTLTIDAFVPEDYALHNIKVAGDYSAVFPLLTVAVFVALQISRQMIFYEKQRCRGDIQALPEALCEPGKEGKPLVMDYDGNLHALDESDHDHQTDSYSDSHNSSDSLNTIDIDNSKIRDDIEANFQEINQRNTASSQSNTEKSMSMEKPNEISALTLEDYLVLDGSAHGLFSEVPPRKSTKKKASYEIKRKKQIQALDNLLNGSIQARSKKDVVSSSTERKKKNHRRTKSEPLLFDDVNHRSEALFSSSLNSLKKPVLKRVDSYGEIDQGQPSLMDQARRRAASGAKSDNNGTKKKY